MDVFYLSERGFLLRKETRMTRDTVKNMRRSKRVPIHAQASFRSASGEAEGVVLQISEGGMLFSTKGDIDVRARGVFTVRFFENEPGLELDCEIIHRLYDMAQSGGPIKYGVRFLDPDASKRETISRVIRYALVREKYFANRDSDS